MIILIVYRGKDTRQLTFQLLLGCSTCATHVNVWVNMFFWQCPVTNVTKECENKTH